MRACGRHKARLRMLERMPGSRSEGRWRRSTWGPQLHRRGCNRQQSIAHISHYGGYGYEI